MPGSLVGLATEAVGTVTVAASVEVEENVDRTTGAEVVTATAATTTAGAVVDGAVATGEASNKLDLRAHSSPHRHLQYSTASHIHGVAMG
jgi:hypothetical protein